MDDSELPGGTVTVLLTDIELDAADRGARRVRLGVLRRRRRATCRLPSKLPEAPRARLNGCSAGARLDDRRRTMQITRNNLETNPGPSDWLTGSVFIDTVAAPSAGSRIGAASVHFTPGARTAWHTHPRGQTIWLTEGVGLCQREGGPVEVIRPGDRVFFEPGENHWHGAAPNRVMVHVAMAPSDGRGSWGEWGR